MGKLQLIIGLGLTTLLLTASEPGYTQEIGTPVRTIDGTEPGVHADILSLKRTEGGILTFRIAFVNETGGEIKNPGSSGRWQCGELPACRFSQQEKCGVMRTSDGACLCTSLNPLTSSEPGKRILWAKFTAPPESVTRISLLLPQSRALR